MKVSIFKDIFANEPIDISVEALLRAIGSDKWKDKIESLRRASKEEYDDLKRYLPCVTFSGTFKRRLASELIEYSGFIVLDIDKIPAEQVVDLKSQLINEPCVRAAFTSPSGNGLKILCQVNSGKDDHKSAFLHLQDYFQRKLEVAIDKSGKDVSRACFVSHDPYLLNKESEPFQVDTTYGAINYSPAGKYYNSTPTNDIDYRLTVFTQWRNNVGDYYAEGNRNNFIHSLACIFNRFGNELQDAISILTSNYDLPEREMVSTIKSAYFHNAHEFGTKNFNDYRTKSDVSEIPMYKGDFTDDIVENSIIGQTIEFIDKKVDKNVVMSYIKTYVDLYNKRGISNFSEKANVSIYNRAVDEHRKKLSEISEINAYDIIDAAEIGFDALKVMPHERAILTSFRPIDLATDGMMPGNFYGIIGTDMTYKSILAQFLAVRTAKVYNKPVLYLNGEMSPFQFYERLTRMTLNKNLKDYIKNGQLTGDNIKPFVDLISKDLNGNLMFYSGKGFTKNSILASLKKFFDKTGKEIGMVIIDGVTQMDWGRENEVGATIKNAEICKSIAVEANESLGTAVVGLFHVSGENDKLFRNTGRKVRGGIKTVASMDGYFQNSLLESNDSSPNNIKYVPGKFYVQYVDKRQGADTIDCIIQLDHKLNLEVEDIDPRAYETSRELPL